MHYTELSLQFDHKTQPKWQHYIMHCPKPSLQFDHKTQLKWQHCIMDCTEPFLQFYHQTLQKLTLMTSVSLASADKLLVITDSLLKWTELCFWRLSILVFGQGLILRVIVRELKRERERDREVIISVETYQMTACDGGLLASKEHNCTYMHVISNYTEIMAVVSFWLVQLTAP